MVYAGKGVMLSHGNLVSNVEATCEAAERYRESLRARVEQEAGTLASLTGWPIEEIRRKVGALPGVDGRTWWQKLYGQ